MAKRAHEIFQNNTSETDETVNPTYKLVDNKPFKRLDGEEFPNGFVYVPASLKDFTKWQKRYGQQNVIDSIEEAYSESAEIDDSYDENSIESLTARRELLGDAMFAVQKTVNKIETELSTVDRRIEVLQEEERKRIQQQQEAEKKKQEEEEAERLEARLQEFMNGVKQPQYRPRTASTPNTVSSIVEAPVRTPRFSKRAKVVGAAVLLSVGGTAAVTDGFGLLPGDEEKNKSEVALTAEQINIGECITEEGSPTPLLSGSISFKEDVSWPIALTENRIGEVKIADEGGNRLPTIEIAAPVNYIDCVPEENKDGFLMLDGNNVTVDLSKVVPQAEIGNNTTQEPIEGFDLPVEEGSPYTKEVADALIAASTDPATITELVNTSRVHARELLAKPESEYSDELQAVLDAYKDAIKSDIEAQAAAQGVEKVNIEFKGELPKTFEFKGPEAKQIDVASIDAATLKVTEFKPIR